MVRAPRWGSMLYDAGVYGILLLIAAVTLIPFVYIIAGSFTASEELLQKGFVLFPTKFSIAAYKYIFSTQTLLSSMRVSVFITVVGTLVNMVMTVLVAYPLSKTELVGRKYLIMGVTFTILFSGGMIPTYLIVKQFGLLNSLWSLILPVAISGFNTLIMINFFRSLPEGLEESAQLDGANDLRILYSIIVPLSGPILATFTLFYAVGHWNSFFTAILYINDAEKWPMQVLLRQMVVGTQSAVGNSDAISEEFFVPPETIKMAVITVSTVPILLVYPFLQKQFTKGVLLGSVKG